MTTGEWQRAAEEKLALAGIATARLDALILLEDVMHKDRSYLLAHPEMALPKTSLKKLNSRIERRSNHEPLAYIRGKTEFYGRDFFVNKYVLEPRPESETIIDLLVEVVASHQSPVISGKNTEDRRQKTGDINLKVVDVGTGSGCLAVTAKLELAEVEVIAIDIDPQCLKVARRNANKLQAEVTLLKGDLLEPFLAESPESRVQDQTARPKNASALSPQLTAILANLPYVPDKFTINRAAMNEPRCAIFGGPDGLDLYRRLFAQTADLSQKPKYILTESLPFQHQKLLQIAESANYKLHIAEDFIQVFYLHG